MGILFPINETTEGGIFMGSRTTDQSLRSDLIALLTLRRGQRPMNNRMFSPLFDYIHEPLDEISKKSLESQIKEKVKEFIPQVELTKIILTPKYEDNLLGVKIYYRIHDFFDESTPLEFNIPTEQFNV